MATSLNKEQIEVAMWDAGLIEPRVIPHMGSDRKLVFELYAGPRGARRRVADVPKTGNSDAVQQAIGKLKNGS